MRAATGENPSARARATDSPVEGEGHSENRDDRRARHAREALAPARGIGPRHASGLVGPWFRAGCRRAAPLPDATTSAQSPAAYTPRRFVSMRSSVRMAPVRPISTPASAATSTFGPEAGRHHRHVARLAIHVVRADLPGRHAKAQRHAVFFEPLPHGPGEGRVLAQQGVWGTLDHRDLEPVAPQRVRRFQPDVTGPDHHGPLRPPLAQEAPHPFSVLRGMQR